MAAGLGEGATLDTIEVDDELEELAQRFFDRSPCGGKIRLHIGSALDIAPDAGRSVRSGLHRRRQTRISRLLPDAHGRRHGAAARGKRRFPAGGQHPLVGQVVAPVARNDLHTQRILEFNRTVADDPRVENVIVPLRDGLNLIR